MKLAKNVSKSTGSLASVVGAKRIFGGSKGRPWTGITCEASKVRKGMAYFHLGPFDAAVVDTAVEAGAAVIVAREGDWSSRGVPTILVDDVKDALISACSEFFGYPEHSVMIVPVVGGSDLSIYSHAVSKLLSAIGLSAAVLGRSCLRVAGLSIPVTKAVKGSPDCFQQVSFARSKHCKSAVLEWSWDEVLGGNAVPMRSDVVLLGQWSKDHEGVTPTQAQLEAMAAWIARSGIQTVVCPGDDIFARRLMAQLPEDVSVTTYGEDIAGSVVAAKVQHFGMSCSFRLRCQRGAFGINLPLPGRTNLMPMLGATGVALARGAEAGVIQRTLDQMDTAPGILERVSGCGHLTCYVDSARDPKELSETLESLRSLGEGRLFVVMGSPMGQDASLRSHMVQVVEQGADQVILTADNPGMEPIEDILGQMLRVATKKERVLAEADRKKAVFDAIGLMGPEDILLVCGKGREQYQDLGTSIVPWDDPSVIREAATPRRLEHLRSRFVLGNQTTSRFVAS